jgi:hypothetical protein
MKRLAEWTRLMNGSFEKRFCDSIELKIENDRKNQARESNKNWINLVLDWVSFYIFYAN